MLHISSGEPALLQVPLVFTKSQQQPVKATPSTKGRTMRAVNALADAHHSVIVSQETAPCQQCFDGCHPFPCAPSFTAVGRKNTFNSKWLTMAPINAPRTAGDPMLEQMVRRRFAQLGKQHPHILRLEVVFRTVENVDQNACSAKAKLNVPGRILCGSEQDKTFEAAFEKIIGVMEHQLQTHNRHRNNRR